MRTPGARSIRGKLLFVVMATTFTSLLVAGIALVLNDVRTYQISWVNDLQTQAEILARASTAALNFDDPEAARENLATLEARPQILAAAIYDASGGLFASFSRNGQSVPRVPGPEGSRVRGNEIVLFHRIVQGDDTPGTVFLRAKYELAQRARRYVGILGFVMGLSLMVAIAMSAALSRVVTRPVFAMTNVAHRVMESRDFSLRAEKTSDDEIGYLTESFNDMLAEIGRRAAALEDSHRNLEREMGERRDAEEALRRANQLKDEFLATLAHELRNPLAPIRNGLELLRLADGNAELSRTARTMMERQLRQLVRLVDDLLDVSRISTGKLIVRPERMELRTAIDSAVDGARALMDERRHRLEVTVPAAGIPLYADPVRLSQVFLNLLNNAAKFTDPGGVIAITGDVEDGKAVVTVSDNGIGLAPEMLPVVFDLFTQADCSLERPVAGLGVGLSLARRLVELHGGRISAESDGPRHGSRFVVRLPLSLESPLPAGPAPLAMHESREDSAGRLPGTLIASNEGIRILIADDNEDFAVSLAQLLRKHHHEVRLAHDGVEAAALAREFSPDIAFLDIGLPGMNGYDLARRLRQTAATRNTVLVAVTGWGQDSDRQRAREAGFDHHAVKPVEPAQVIELIAALRRPTAPRA